MKLKSHLHLACALFCLLGLIASACAPSPQPAVTPTPGGIRPPATASAVATQTALPAYTPTVRPTTPPPTATPTAQPTPVPPTSTPPPPALSPDMVLVPAGEFIMGSDEGRSNEQPAHTVYLDAFYIDKIEVTNAQFAQFLNKRGNQEEGGATWLDITDKDCLITKSLGRYQPKRGYENHPVIEVTWYGARAYCEWRGRSVSEQVRLPTEAEWEKAAGWDPATGAKRVYPWGDEWDASLVNADWPITTPTELRPVITAEGKPHTAPVGSKPEGASPYGVLDMAGNAWEWMADWYAEDYYSRSPSQNPQGAGPGECTVLGPGVEDVDECKVLRGGSWRSTPSFVRTTVRDHIYPAFSYDVGFRCAKPSTATLVSEGDSASPEATPTATVTSVSDATTPLSGSSSGQIVFGSNPDGSWDIYIMNADGTGQQRLTTGVCKTWGATLSRLRKSIRRPSQASKPLLLARLDQANQR